MASEKLRHVKEREREMKKVREEEGRGEVLVVGGWLIPKGCGSKGETSKTILSNTLTHGRKSKTEGDLEAKVTPQVNSRPGITHLLSRCSHPLFFSKDYLGLFFPL